MTWASHTVKANITRLFKQIFFELRTTKVEKNVRSSKEFLLSGGGVVKKREKKTRKRLLAKYQGLGERVNLYQSFISQR